VRHTTHPRTLATLAVAVLIQACGGQSEDGPSPAAGGSPPGGAGGAGGSVAQSGGTGATTARSCEQIEADYTVALQQAQSCAPTMSSLQCTELVSVGLVCACPEALNARRPDAIALTLLLQAEYLQADCVGDVVCAACMDAQGGGCAPEGHCVTYGPD
jgi:hypothetical protein